MQLTFVKLLLILVYVANSINPFSVSKHCDVFSVGGA